MKLCLLPATMLLIISAAPGTHEQPKLVAEGVISTADDESGFTLAPDGRTAFFGKTTPTTTGDPMQVICVTRLGGDGKWTVPEIAPFSGHSHDLGPSFQPDGSRLYFISDRPAASGRKDFNIWYVDAGGWREPHILPPPVNSPDQEYGVSVAADGTLYFASNRKGGAGSFDIYRSRRQDGAYATAEDLGENINTKGPELEPAISPDGNTLVFAALGRDDEQLAIHKAYARGDLYVSFRRDGVWTAAHNCGPAINSGAEESWPSFSSDGRILFFSSERGFATYRLAERMTWGELEHALRSITNGLGNIYELNASMLASTASER